MARYNSVNSISSVAGGNSISSPASGLLTTLTGSGVVTVPNPVYYTGQTQTFYNSTLAALTLTTPSGNFVAPGFTSASTISLPSGSIITLASDGTNYLAQDWLGGIGQHTALTSTGGISATGGVVTLTSSTTGSMDNVTIGANTARPGTFNGLTNTLGTTSLAGGSASGVFSFTSGQASNAFNNGSVVVTGGVGISGAIYGNSTLNLANTLTVSSGGASINGSVSINGVGDLQLGRTDSNSFSITMSAADVAANKGLTFQKTGGGNLYNVVVSANATYLNNGKTYWNGYGGNDVLEVNVAAGNTSPFMRFKTNGSNNGYIQFTDTSAFIWSDRQNKGLRVDGSAYPAFYDGSNYQTVWHAGLSPTNPNQGVASGGGQGVTSGSGPNAKQLNGYSLENFEVMEKNYGISLTSGSTGTFYALEIAGATWGSGVSNMYIRRTSVHQDSSGYGAFFGKLRYRSTAWGHHRDFWEVEDNWGAGTYYPFLAKMQGHPYTAYEYMWLRGGLTYYVMFGQNDYINQNPVAAHLTLSYVDSTFPTLGNSVTSVSLPSQARYYQQDLCSQGYNLGQSGYAWANVYTTNAVTVTSDRRLKENFGQAYGLDFVMALKPCSFTMIDNRLDKSDHAKPHDGRRKQGLVAQDLKDTMDQLGISEHDFSGYDGTNPDHLAVQYEQFIPMLINSIQQQQQQIQTLQARISQLESK
jgi:hypothetical protein